MEISLYAKPLNARSEHLVYPLEELSVLSYSVSDTLSEKLRAIITRKGGIHERDIFDLFLLHNLNHKCFNIEKEIVKEKVKQGIGYRKNKEEEIKLILGIEERLDELEKIFEEEIKDMILRDYDSKEYFEFFRQLKKYLKSSEFKDW